MLTNKEFSEKLETPLTKVRRWTKEFLSPDPKATRRSGYTREFSYNDGFFIFVGGVMVTDFGLSFEEASTMLEELKPWMLEIGLVPDIPGSAKIEGLDKEIEKYNLIFQFGWAEAGIAVDIHVQGIVHEYRTEHENPKKGWPPYERVREERIEYWLTTVRLNHIVDKFYQETLHISSLLEIYINAINLIPVDPSEVERLRNEGKSYSGGSDYCYDTTESVKALREWGQKRKELKVGLIKL